VHLPGCSECLIDGLTIQMVLNGPDADLERSDVVRQCCHGSRFPKIIGGAGDVTLDERIIRRNGLSLLELRKRAVRITTI